MTNVELNDILLMMTQKNKKLLLGIIFGLMVFLITSYYADNTSIQSQAYEPAESEDAVLETGQEPDYFSDNGDEEGSVVESEYQLTEEAIQTNAKVISVVDGDTIEVEMDSEPGKTVRVRLLGINTPETVDPRRPVECFGKQASDFAKRTLSDKRIWLESDPEADEVDKYGRLLRNVFLPDGTDFNAFMVENGYAYAYVSFPQNKARKTELRALEQSAKENNLGLWNPEICP